MNTIADKIRSFVDDDKLMEKLINNVREIQKANFIKHKAFYESFRFTEILLKAHDYLIDNGYIADDSYAKFLFDDVTNEEFIMMFNCVKNENIIGGNALAKESCNGEVYHFSGLSFSILHGQGTAYIITKTPE